MNNSLKDIINFVKKDIQKNWYKDLGVSLISAPCSIVAWTLGSIFVQEVNDRKDFNWIAFFQRKTLWIFTIILFFIIWGRRIKTRYKEKKEEKKIAQLFQSVITSTKKYEDGQKTTDIVNRMMKGEKSLKGETEPTASPSSEAPRGNNQNV